MHIPECATNELEILSFDEALQKAYGYEGRDAKVAVVPDGLAVIVG